MANSWLYHVGEASYESAEVSRHEMVQAIHNGEVNVKQK